MLQGKLLRVAIVLIALFTATIYFVTSNRVDDLMEKSVSEKLNNVSIMGLNVINGRHI